MLVAVWKLAQTLFPSEVTPTVEYPVHSPSAATSRSIMGRSLQNSVKPVVDAWQ